MNRTLETIREFKRRNFTVRVTAEEEYDLDLSFDETGEVRRKLDNGELMAFCVKAAVYVRGKEVATDYLGDCIYKTPREFMDHWTVRKATRKFQAQENRKAKKEGREPRKVCCGSYFSDMVRTVCTEARKELASLRGVYLRQTA